jgi:Domain of unknown function (DUF4159)
MTEFSRRSALGLAALTALFPSEAGAFGEASAFNPRLLSAGARQNLKGRETGAARWSWELVRRTSAPARLVAARFFALGGLLLVDDSAPEVGAFGRSARRELARVLPESPPVRLDPSHVIYKTFYILDRPYGRAPGTGSLEAILRGKMAQAVFIGTDLLGALSRVGEAWAFEVPGGAMQRERAIRVAVNLAMYVLCSDYKDDQVHAPWLMRRRAGLRR